MEKIISVLNDSRLVRPDFMIIGAMKCATSTIHEQLGVHDSFFMTTPKEPCFFSNDDIFAKGIGWYADCFKAASSGQLKGESSTHYTKLPTYPKTIHRIKEFCPDAKFIYVMRHPIDRLISHYIHDWTEGIISCDIDHAVKEFENLIEYGLYHKQLLPFMKNFKRENILLLFMENLKLAPQYQLQRIFSFLEVEEKAVWQKDLKTNISADRMRKNVLRDYIIDNRAVKYFRRTFVAKSVRTRIRGFWQMKKRPDLSSTSTKFVSEIFDKDLNRLGKEIGLNINCANFREVAERNPDLNWKI